MGKSPKPTEKTVLPPKVKMQIALLKAVFKGKKGLQIAVILALYCLVTGLVINLKWLINLLQFIF